jgi:endonuclease/exonuclease/phosphatase family metal-dependent hydrolase
VEALDRMKEDRPELSGRSSMSAPPTYTLASYNIHSGIGTDGRFDLARVAKVLEEIDADIVALQEVGDFLGRTASVKHPEELADALGMHMVFGPNIERNGRRYGNAVLSRLPILNSRNYDLSVHRREPRGALRADLDLGEDKVLHVFCLHLGLSVGERRRQENLLLSADILRDAVRKDPVIVCGDFNYWWNGPVPRLVRSAIHDAGHLLGKTARTYPSKLPLFRLDRVFVDDGVSALSLATHRTQHARHASDHLPLVLKFQPVVRQTPRAHFPARVVA